MRYARNMRGNMILSDQAIEHALASGRIVIKPLGENAIQPSSVDIRLGGSLLVFRNASHPYVDTRKPVRGLTTEVAFKTADDPFIMHPGEFVLGATFEHIEVPDDLVCRIEGRSSLGRLGIVIHSTAGYVDPGWRGPLTLELSNVSNLPVTLYAAMGIGQLSFHEMTGPALRPYGSKGLGSKYQDSKGPVDSRIHQEEEDAGEEMYMVGAEIVCEGCGESYRFEGDHLYLRPPCPRCGSNNTTPYHVRALDR